MCPKCKGGSTGEKRLSLLRTDTHIKWHCHRASCGYSGMIAMIAGSKEEMPSRREISTFQFDLQPMPLSMLAFFKDKYGLDEPDMDSYHIRWDAQKRRVGFRIAGRVNELVGWSMRSFEGATPKSIIHVCRPDKPCMSWYTHNTAGGDKFAGQSRQSAVVVVEDQLSAIRAAKWAEVDAVALLGTGLNHSKIAELVAFKPKRTIIALDKDATKLGGKYVRQLQGILDNVELKILEKDVKDTSVEEIRSMFL